MDHVMFDALTTTWSLTTASTTYVLRLVDGELKHVYWGPWLPPHSAGSLPQRARSREEVVGLEMPGEGGERFGVAAVQLVFADGTQATELRFAGHEAGPDWLRVLMADRHYPVEIELNYRVIPEADVVERWAVLRHTGSADSQPIAVQRFDAAVWTLPVRADYRLSHVAGEWLADFQLKRDRVPYGEMTFTSRRGATRHQSNPWLMVDAGEATEESGDVWSFALAWSGTWRITARRTYNDDLIVNAGAGHDGATRRLAPGEQIQTPICAAMHSTEGFGATSRRWHDYVRGHVLPCPDELRPVLYNTWEGVEYDMTEPGLVDLADHAATLGVELFVVDDGWFANRTSVRAGLGDWWPNPGRFPNGLRPLVDHVHDLGMLFGIWVEPEMVNPDSDLYRAHPDWVLHMANRQRTEHKQQLVLNFGRPDVASWAYDWLNRLIGDNAIDFVKWDMNRPFTEAGWPDRDDPQRLWFDHTDGVYATIDRLRASHPGLRFETCSSGGGRIDLGILRRADQAWVSDNTDPVDRIAIQAGYSQLYPAVTMGAWASESPNQYNHRSTPARFRFHVAMAGLLGVSGDLRAWSAEERKEAQALIAQYKEIRHIVQHGRLYRLPSLTAGTTAVQYVTDDRDESVVFVWRPHAVLGRPSRPVRLAGLDADARYDDGNGKACDGRVLLNHGIQVDLPPGDYASVVTHLRRVTG